MIEKLVDFARKNGQNIYWISEISNGKETSVKVTPSNDCNDVYSVSKTFTSTAIGILRDRGQISLDENVYDIFSSDYPDMDEKWKGVTVFHVLTHTVGIRNGFYDIDVEDISSHDVSDYLGVVLSHVPEDEPGGDFVYSDSNYYLASRIFTKKSGEELCSFLQRELFFPLRFQGQAFTRCPAGYSMGATGLFLRTIDMARLGKLYLDGGVCRGKRILSEDWCNYASTAKVLLAPDAFYAFGISGNPQKDYFTAGGMYGQKIFVSRKHGYVIAWTGHEEDGSSERLTDILISQE